jgi:hypothetical protein
MTLTCRSVKWTVVFLHCDGFCIKASEILCLCTDTQNP